MAKIQGSDRRAYRYWVQNMFICYNRLGNGWARPESIKQWLVALFWIIPPIWSLEKNYFYDIFFMNWCSQIQSFKWFKWKSLSSHSIQKSLAFQKYSITIEKKINRSAVCNTILFEYKTFFSFQPTCQEDVFECFWDEPLESRHEG
jgi:hypothetical protein